MKKKITSSISPSPPPVAVEATGTGNYVPPINAIGLLELDLGREDLNAIVGKLNEVIKKLNEC